MKAGISIFCFCICFGLSISCSHNIHTTSITEYVYSNGNIRGNICNVNYIINNKLEYKVSTMSCGHGVEANCYQTKNNGYYFVSCSKNFDIAKFEPDTIFLYKNTTISIGKINYEFRIKREWKSGFYVVHSFFDESNSIKNLKCIKNIKVY